MTIERPMFPPRAESVQPAVRQPDSETLTSESRKPAEGAAVVQFPAQPKEKPTKRKSAVVGVKRSGLELVPAKKRPRGKSTPKSELAIQKYCAKIKWKPWKKRDSDLEAFGQHWNSTIGVSVRVGYALMLMSKQDMIEFHRDMDHDQVDIVFANTLEAAEFLKYTAGILEEVYRRLLVSAYTALDQGVIGDGKQPVRFEGFETRPTLVRQR